MWTVAVTAWLVVAAAAQDERPDWLKPGVQWPVESIALELQNPADVALRQHPVIIDLHELNLPNAGHWVVTTAAGVRLPAQADDLNRDGTKDELAFLADFEPGQSRRVFIYPFRGADPPATPLKKRVHARLALNDEAPQQEITAADGDMYRQAQHHGPAWESELIAYRVYFDKKSSIDIYGKRTHQLELERTKWYSSSELRENGFGQDIVHVGATLGVGSVRGWNGEKNVLMNPVASRTARVLADGPVRAIVELAAQGWQSPAGKCTVTSRFIIYAGKRYAIHEVRVDGQGNLLPPLCTGIRKSKEQEIYREKGLMVSWGVDGLGQTHGMGVYVPQSYFSNHVETEQNHVVLLKSGNRKTVRFLFAAAWKKEPAGPTNKAAFEQYMKDLARRAFVSVEIGTVKNCMKTDETGSRSTRTATRTVNE